MAEESAALALVDAAVAEFAAFVAEESAALALLDAAVALVDATVADGVESTCG